MRLQLDELILELKLRLADEKSIRNKVLLKQALKALQDYKAVNEKMV